MTIIRCIDFETTGIPTDDDKHAIVEIGWCDLEDGTVAIPDAVLCDPGRPIPNEAKAIHHITDEDVSGQTGSLDVLGKPDYFAAHVADFERQFITTDVPFICTYKVALRIWPEAPSHSRQFLRYHLNLYAPANRAMPPHRAAPDAYLCATLMQAILNIESRPTLKEMARWSSGPALLPRLPFGKHKGQKWEDVPIDYLTWIADKSDLDRDMKANARHHLKQRSA